MGMSNGSSRIIRSEPLATDNVPLTLPTFHLSIWGAFAQVAPDRHRWRMCSCQQDHRSHCITDCFVQSTNHHRGTKLAER